MFVKELYPAAEVDQSSNCLAGCFRFGLSFLTLEQQVSYAFESPHYSLKVILYRSLSTLKLAVRFAQSAESFFVHLAEQAHETLDSY